MSNAHRNEHTKKDDPDPLDQVLQLEETFYQQGYEQGVRDGHQAGLVEGRSVGIKTGFEKFRTMGMLHGRAEVWAGMLSSSSASIDSDTRMLPRVRNLYALTEPASLSTKNNESDVAQFDDRLKRAQGKFKVLEMSVQKAKGRPTQKQRPGHSSY